MSSRNTRTPATLVAESDEMRDSHAELVTSDAQSDAQNVTSDAEQSDTSDAQSDAESVTSDDTSDAGDAQSDAEQSDTSNTELAGDALAAAAAQFSQAHTPATPAPARAKMTRAAMKRITSVRMIELIAANVDTLCEFDDDAMRDASRAFVANYFSYAPAIQSLVTHNATIDEIVNAARSL